MFKISKQSGVVKQTKRFIVFVIGMALLLLGIALLVLPGPAFPFLIAGLILLATQFHWAKTILKDLKMKLKRVKKLHFLRMNK